MANEIRGVTICALVGAAALVGCCRGVCQSPYALRSTKVDGGEIIALSPDGRLLAFARQDRSKITIWDLKKDREVGTFDKHRAGVTALAFSPDGKHLVATSGFLVDLIPKKGVGELFIFDVKQATLVKSLSTSSYDFKTVRISPNGRLVAASSQDGFIRIWDVSSKQLKVSLRGSAAAFAPNSLLAISTDDEGGCALHDCDKGQTIQRFKIGNERINAMAFSPDGSRLAVADVDQVVRVWDLKNQQVLGVLKGHSRWIWAISFSADGKLLASAGADKTVRLWDMITFKQVGQLSGHRSDVISVLFAGTNDEIISASLDREIKVWRRPTKGDKHTPGKW